LSKDISEMFTGITEHVGKIEAFTSAAEGVAAGARLRVSLAGAGEIYAAMKLGDSMSVSGCCLTVVDFSSAHFSADLSGETLARTSLGAKKPGDLVNLERPLAVNARLGGHFVQGHVDGTGVVTRLEPQGNNWWLSVRVPESLRRYVAEKASIAIDGISLTVARWHAKEGVADVAVIPLTYAHTSVRTMAAGGAVNLEVDILAKYVESLLSGSTLPSTAGEAAARKPSSATRLTISNLVDQGF
jgi:riboflavin synthase